MLRIENLNVEIAESLIIKDISLTIPDNKIVGLIGESGSGKSTLIKTIAGLHSTKAWQIKGRILFDELNLLELNEQRMANYRGEKISLVLQKPSMAFNPMYSTITQIKEIFTIHQRPVNYQRIEYLKEVCQIADLKKKPYEYSGGQLQRIAIMLSLMLEPELVLFDEVISALDQFNKKQMLALLQDLKQDISGLFVTHDLEAARNICDVMAVINEGELVEIKETEKLFSKPEHPYTQYLLTNTIEHRFNRRK